MKPIQLHHQRGCNCPDCTIIREDRAAWLREAPKKTRLPLHLSIGKLVYDFMQGVKSGNYPAGANYESDLANQVERRIKRYVSADHIAMILSEDAHVADGKLTNVGYLAVKIAESIERGDAA